MNGTPNETALDVIIPIKNGERYIHDSVRCVLNQTISDRIHILLIDDGSDDNTGKICDELAAANKSISSFHLDGTGGGVSAARNYGLSQSTAEYVAFMDVDDFLYSDCYETLLKNASENNCDISACAYVTTQSRILPEQDRDKKFSFFLIEDQKEALANMICGEKSIEGYVWNKIFRRDTIKDVLFPSYRFCEDCIFSWDAVSHSARICYTDKPLYVYYVSHKLYPPMDDGIRVYKELLARCDKNGIDSPEVINCLKRGYVDHVIAFARNIALFKSKKSDGKATPTKTDARRYLKEIKLKGIKIRLVQRVRRFLLKHCWPLFVLSEKIMFSYRQRKHN